MQLQAGSRSRPSNDETSALLYFIGSLYMEYTSQMEKGVKKTKGEKK